MCRAVHYPHLEAAQQVLHFPCYLCCRMTAQALVYGLLAGVHTWGFGTVTLSEHARCTHATANAGIDEQAMYPTFASDAFPSESNTTACCKRAMPPT